MFYQILSCQGTTCEGFEIKTKSFGLVDAIPAPSFGVLIFPNPMRAPNNIHGLLLSATQLRSHGLHSVPLGL